MLSKCPLSGAKRPGLSSSSTLLPVLQDIQPHHQVPREVRGPRIVPWSPCTSVLQVTRGLCQLPPDPSPSPRLVAPALSQLSPAGQVLYASSSVTP